MCATISHKYGENHQFKPSRTSFQFVCLAGQVMKGTDDLLTEISILSQSARRWPFCQVAICHRIFETKLANQTGGSQSCNIYLLNLHFTSANNFRPKGSRKVGNGLNYSWRVRLSIFVINTTFPEITCKSDVLELQIPVIPHFLLQIRSDFATRVSAQLKNSSGKKVGKFYEHFKCICSFHFSTRRNPDI